MALKYRLKEEPAEIGDVTISNGSKTTVTDIDAQTGAISWSVEYIPNFEKLYSDVDDLVTTAKGVATKTKNDKKLRDIFEEAKKLKNQIRTHLRNEYPDQYKTFGPGSMKEVAQDIKVELPNITKTKANNQITTVSGFADFILDAWDEVAEKEQEGIQKNAFIKQARAFLQKAKGEDKKLPQVTKEAYSGFIRNPEDPDSEKFEPTGAVAEFREEIRALFGKFKGDLKNPEFIKGVAQIMNNWKPLLRSQLDEAKKKKAKKKDNRPIGKPMRDTSGGKAYKVYVKDPKTKKVKTVRFGSGGLRAKINDSKARKAFAARHKCSQKKDRTKASYWSCRLPRYAKLLGLKSSFSGFW